MTVSKKRIETLAARLTRAKSELAKARHELASVTRPGDPDLTVAPEWRWAERLLEKRRPSLMRIPGVISCSLGHRLRGGTLSGEPCITVLVERKFSRSDLKRRKRKSIPRFLREGRRTLPVDVVELGRIERQAFVGGSLGPEAKRLKGTIGAFADDDESVDRVAITAMHVSGRREYPPASGSPAVPFCSPSKRDSPNASRFGFLRRGTMTRVDAAKIALLDPDDAVPVIPQIGPVRGWRTVTFPGDHGTPVRLFGATSGLNTGRIVNPSVSIPDIGIEKGILVDIHTSKGDSGAALVDPENLILGFLVGRTLGSGLRVFSPVSSVLHTLRCELLV